MKGITTTTCEIVGDFTHLVPHPCLPSDRLYWQVEADQGKRRKELLCKQLVKRKQKGSFIFHVSFIPERIVRVSPGLPWVRIFQRAEMEETQCFDIENGASFPYTLLFLLWGLGGHFSEFPGEGASDIAQSICL